MYLENKIETRKGQWVSGVFTDQSQFGTAILNAKAIGYCEACEDIITLDYTDVEGD